jgi:hypothetical protein
MLSSVQVSLISQQKNDHNSWIQLGTYFCLHPTTLRTVRGPQGEHSVCRSCASQPDDSIWSERYHTQHLRNINLLNIPNNLKFQYFSFRLKMTHQFSIMKTWEGLPFGCIQLLYYITIAIPCTTEVRRSDKPKVSTVWEQHCQSSLKAVDKCHIYSTVLLPNCFTGPSISSDQCQSSHSAHMASDGWMPLQTIRWRRNKAKPPMAYYKVK